MTAAMTPLPTGPPRRVGATRLAKENDNAMGLEIKVGIAAFWCRQGRFRYGKMVQYRLKAGAAGMLVVMGRQSTIARDTDPPDEVDNHFFLRYDFGFVNHLDSTPERVPGD